MFVFIHLNVYLCLLCSLIVVPIKSCYSPVTLNPPSLPKKKVERNSTDKKIAAENVSSPKPPQPPAPTNTSAPVTASSAENSVSSQKSLQEVAELHARLQAALREQVSLQY